MKRKRRMLRCKHCKYEWYGGNPKVCPFCHNDWRKKPTANMRYRK